jgi:hypothetical protein
LYDYTTWGYLNEVTVNAAKIEGKGVDVIIKSKNIDNTFKWSTSLLFNYNTDKVTDYHSFSANAITSKIGSGIGVLPVIGKPLYAIAAYKWGGLDANGNPQGYANGQLSTNYIAIINEGSDKGVNGNVVYKGPSSPIYFGSLTNTFSFKNFSLSALISYKMGYYFRKMRCLIRH